MFSSMRKFLLSAAPVARASCSTCDTASAVSAAWVTRRCPLPPLPRGLQQRIRPAERTRSVRPVACLVSCRFDGAKRLLSITFQGRERQIVLPCQALEKGLRVLVSCLTQEGLRLDVIFAGRDRDPSWRVRVLAASLAPRCEAMRAEGPIKPRPASSMAPMKPASSAMKP